MVISFAYIVGVSQRQEVRGPNPKRLVTKNLGSAPVLFASKYDTI